MAKNYKHRVKIAVSEDGYPVYKWASGHNLDELNENIVKIYIENGLISKLVEKYGYAPIPIAEKSTCPYFEEYASKWFETYKVPILKPTTCMGYRSNLRVHIYPFFGKMRLDEITTEHIQTFLNEREPLARNTVHTMFVLFGSTDSKRSHRQQTSEYSFKAKNRA